MKDDTIIITRNDGYYTVVVGNRFNAGMDEGECLACVARLLVLRERGEDATARWQRLEAHWDREQKIRDQIASRLRPVDRLLLQEAHL